MAIGRESTRDKMDVPLANEQSALAFDGDRVRSAVTMVLSDAGRTDGLVSLAVVDDPTIHRLNVEYLDHDYPTDVLSFVIEDDGQRLEGEVIVSADTAIANAAEYGWPAEHELLLYFVHGALHLVGYLDKSEEDAARMRAAEADYLGRFGIDLQQATTEGASAK